MQLMTESAPGMDLEAMMQKEKRMLSEQQGMVARRRAIAAGVEASDENATRNASGARFPPPIKLAPAVDSFDDFGALFSPMNMDLGLVGHEVVSDGQEAPALPALATHTREHSGGNAFNFDFEDDSLGAVDTFGKMYQHQQQLHHHDSHYDLVHGAARELARGGEPAYVNGASLPISDNDDDAITSLLFAEPLESAAAYTQAYQHEHAAAAAAQGLEVYDESFSSIIDDLASGDITDTSSSSSATTLASAPTQTAADLDDAASFARSKKRKLEVDFAPLETAEPKTKFARRSTGDGFSTPSVAGRTHGNNQHRISPLATKHQRQHQHQHQQKKRASALPHGVLQAPPAVAAAAARLGTNLPYAPAPGSSRDPLAALRAGSSKVAGKRWTPEQDEQLRMAVNKYKSSNWKAIAQCVAGRNHVQCLQRWKKVLQPGLIKGMWSQDEDDKLLELLAQQGEEKSWTKIADHIPGRTAKQCRERWHLNLDPSINRGPWTKQEDDILMGLHAKIGNKWAEIKRSLPGRTENGVKSRFKSIQRALNKDTRFA